MASPQIQVGAGMQGLLKDGYQSLSGLELAIMKNIEACNELGKITRTSLGPNGMNKLVINHLEKIFVTSDAATIMNEMEVIHPAAKMIVMAAKMQEAEYGDSTNFVITFASELLLQAKELLRKGVHPSEIINGYTKAVTKSLGILHELTCHTVTDVRDEEQLSKAIFSVISAKQNGYEDTLMPLVTEACTTIMPNAPKKASINMDSVRIAKLMGGSIFQSVCVKGMIVRRPPEGSVSRIENAKVAVFGMAVEAAQTETKGTVSISNAEELLNYNKSEEALMEEQIKGIKDSGVDVVISGGSISEMALHFIERYKMMAIRIASKWELRRLCRTVGASTVVRLGPVMPDEMGHCDLVETTELAGGRCVIFRQDAEETRVATILLRSSTINQLDDLERACSDGANTIKTLCADPRLLPGAGAWDIGLASKIASMGDATPGLEQYAIHKFAEALEVVPRVLAENAGKDAHSVISTLYAAHKKGESNMGVDIDAGRDDLSICDATKKNLYDAYATKYNAIRLAADAAITILRVDQIIMSKQAGGPKPPKQ